MSMEALAGLIYKWKHDILLFGRSCGFEGDEWQKRALLSFGDLSKKHHYISLQACVGPGKTAVMAICTLWFMLCLKREGKGMKNAAVSITRDNLSETYWPELRVWMEKNEVLHEIFEWRKSGLWPREEGLRSNWCMLPKSFAQDADKHKLGSTMAGRHSPDILSVIEEAGGMPIEIKESAEQTMTNPPEEGYSRIIMSGNPIDTKGALYAALNDEKYETICITADPDDPERTPRVPAKLVQDKIDNSPLGREDPFIMSRYLGKYPKNPFNMLIGKEEVLEAMNRKLSESAYRHSQRRMGVDVGGGGYGDVSAIFQRQGLNAKFPIFTTSDNKRLLSNYIIQKKLEWKSEYEFLDGTGGWASAIEQNLLEAGHNIYPVHFNQKPRNTKGFGNIRAENYWEFAKWIRKGGALPYDEELMHELCAHSYSTHPTRGVTMLEPKESVKSKIKRSPNKSDAASLTFTLPEESASSLKSKSFLQNKILSSQSLYDEPKPYYDNFYA